MRDLLKESCLIAYFSSLRKQPTLRDATGGFPAGMTSEKRAQKFHTDDVHYPDLGTDFDWMKQIFDQTGILSRSGISALVCQTSFRGETAGGVSKCQLPSPPGEVLTYISHIGMCRPKGWGFAAFWSENEYRLCLCFSGIRYGFRGNYGSL